MMPSKRCMPQGSWNFVSATRGITSVDQSYISVAAADAVLAGTSAGWMLRSALRFEFPSWQLPLLPIKLPINKLANLEYIDPGRNDTRKKGLVQESRALILSGTRYGTKAVNSSRDRRICRKKGSETHLLDENCGVFSRQYEHHLSRLGTN